MAKQATAQDPNSTAVRTTLTAKDGTETPGVLHVPKGREDLIARTHAFTAGQNPGHRVVYEWETDGKGHRLDSDAHGGPQESKRDGLAAGEA
jgi:hypothetical protein